MSDVLVFPKQAETFLKVLGVVQKKTKANYVQFAHVSGTILAEVGKFTGMDPSMFAALAAGSYSSTSTMGQIIGEKQFSSICHIGSKHSLHITPIGDKALLILIYNSPKIPFRLNAIIEKFKSELVGSVGLIGATTPLYK
jgi:predicted regulator of Ras-like GTPase activity (Roadblock/LC7/MglB family)